VRRFPSLLLIALLGAPLLLAACGGGCPEVVRIDASTEDPSLVRLLFSVQCSGEPVTSIDVSDLTLIEGGAEVSTSEAEWSLTQQSATLETYTLLLIDVSDSIIEGGTLPVAQEVAIEFVDGLVAGNQQISVAIFDGSTDIRSVVDFTDDVDNLTAAIEGINADSQLDESTNLNGAMLQGLEILDEVVVPDIEAEMVSVANLVVFTDGVDRAGRVTGGTASGAVDGSEHHVFLVGLGVAGDDVEDLEALGKDGFFLAENAADLNDAFDDLTDRLVAEVNKFYRLSYCSPLRKPRTTLKVQVTHEEKTDAITFSYPTKDFGPGCSAD
jgi:hypothetical protein